jgi:mannosyltransferase OCH1-like enzyme
LTLLLCDRCVGSIHTKTSTSNRENIDAVVPNLLHYVHLNKGDLSFFVLVNIQTAIINLHPDTVYIYTLYAPQGKYWDIMLSAGNVIVEVVETPISIWGHVPGPTDFAHMSDIIRMKALMQRGGIYLDTDMVVFASFDAFRTEPFTIGFCKEFGNARVFSNSVVIAQNSSVFLQLWYDSYKNVNFKCWDWYVLLVDFISFIVSM